MEEKIGVYIRVNKQNEIIEVGSNVFIENFDNWIFVDEGFGDKYAHAQNQYLEKPIIDDNGIYNYIFKNNKITEKTKEIDWLYLFLFNLLMIISQTCFVAVPFS